tara:strand:+ start:3878 stop:4189 length:312 start_codon:yes stop_codon:yes gene_type:complete
MNPVEVSFVRYGDDDATVYLMIQTPFMSMHLKETLCFLAACQNKQLAREVGYETAHRMIMVCEFEYYSKNSIVLIEHENPECNVHILNAEACHEAYGEYLPVC